MRFAQYVNNNFGSGCKYLTCWGRRRANTELTSKNQLRDPPQLRSGLQALLLADETTQDRARAYETAPRAAARCAVCARRVGDIRSTAGECARQGRPARSLASVALGPSGEGRRAALRA